MRKALVCRAFFLLLLIMFLGSVNAQECGETELKKTKEVSLLIAKQYYGDVTLKPGLIKCMDEFLSQFNPAVRVLAKEEAGLERAQSQFEAGVGLAVSASGEYPEIVSAVPHTIEAKGIRPNDFLIEINGKSVRNMPVTSVVKKLKGKKRSKVELSIKSPSDESTRVLETKRRFVNRRDYFQSEMFASGILYLRGVTCCEPGLFLRRLEKIWKRNEKNIPGVILDLRNSSPLQVSMSDWDATFLEAGKVFVKAKFKRGVIPVKTHNREGRKEFIEWLKSVPLVVMINESTTDYDEVLAFAYKEEKRGMVLGERTVGESGYIYSHQPFSDGGVVIFTTGEVLSSSDGRLALSGVEPDVLVDSGDIEFIDDMYKDNVTQEAEKLLLSHNN